LDRIYYFIIFIFFLDYGQKSPLRISSRRGHINQLNRSISQLRADIFRVWPKFLYWLSHAELIRKAVEIGL